MFTITIAFGRAPAMWRLVFKTKESADKAWQLTSVGDPINIIDDYGQMCEIPAGSVVAKMYENLLESNQASIALQINNQKIHVAVQKTVENNPQLRMARGPAVLQPMGGFPGNGRAF